MTVLVGIDEAGYGPILGPLVVSSSSFSLPDELVEKDLWEVLRKSVSKTRKHLKGRLLVADSKKAYSKSKGIGTLERTVLSFLGCLGQKAGSVAGLVRILCPDCVERLKGYPWYEDVDGFDISGGQSDVAIAGGVVREDMASNGIELLDMQSRCLDVGYYNEMVGNVKNKADVLFTATCQLIQRAFDSCDCECLQVLVDRQGGRVHYRRNLQRMFGGMELKILCEKPASSSYELSGGGRRMRLHFAIGADERFFPVSLASMASKYLRQLLVGNINRYFAGHCAELKPTAGYWKDGLRFIEDLKMKIPHVKYESDQLIRCR